MTKAYDVYVWQLLIDAQATGETKRVREQLASFQKILREHPEVADHLTQRRLLKTTREQWLRETFADELLPLVVDFLARLIQEDLLGKLKEAIQFYDETVRHHLENEAGVLEGDVYSAVPLTEQQTQTLTDALSAKFQAQVVLQVHVDEALIGGYKVKIKQQIYDHTVQAHLKQLKASLADELSDEEVKENGD